MYGATAIPPAPKAEAYILPMRQERILVIPLTHLMAIFSGTAKFWLPEEIPVDSKLLRSFQDDASHSVCIVVKHPSFTPIPIGNAIPKYSLLVTYPQWPAVVAAPEPVAKLSDESLDNREV